MLGLAHFRRYWEDMASRVDGIDGVLPVTVDSEMGRKIQALPASSCTLIVFPPMAEAASSRPDAYGETNRCVVFVMAKYNPARRSSFEVLEDVQPVAEAVKAALLSDASGPCSALDVDVSTIETAPETEMYGTFAGWSIAFEANTF